nr:ComEC/Rec2 family competence protein [Salinimonas marina]
MTCFCIASLSAVIWPVLPHPLLLAGCWLLVTGGQLIYRHCARDCLFVPASRQNGLPSDYRNFVLTGISGLLLGALWMASLGYWYVGWQQPSVNFKQDKLINITVLHSTRIKLSEQCRVTARLHSRQLVSAWLRPKVILYWQAYPGCPQPGTSARIQARLKPVRSLRNPGAADTARLRLSQKVVYTGQVKAVLQMAYNAPETLHQSVTDELMMVSLPNKKWTLALLTGYRQLLERPDWQLLQQTGTAHIFSISGMHLAIIAGWAALLARVGYLPVIWLAARTGRQPNLRPVVLLLTLGAALAYTALANWQLPVTRALLLIILFVVAQQSRLQLSNPALILCMLLVCILVFPFSVYGSSLYLSLGAVLWLWLIHWRAAPVLNRFTSKLIWMITLQVALSLALVPATLGFFEILPLAAPLFNLLILPIISLLLPLGLLATLLYFVTRGFISGPLYLFDDLLGRLVGLLQNLQEVMPGAASVHLTKGVLVALVLALTIILCPPFVFRKRFASMLLVPLLLSPVSFNYQHWYLHVVDVGQGSALLISRGRHAILIDTGPASPMALVPLAVRSPQLCTISI